MMMKTRNYSAVTGLSLAFMLTAYSSLVNAQTNPGLTDAEVASVAVTANLIDINAAELAKQKSKDAEILQFAQTMKRDHSAVNEQAAALAKRLGVVPKDNAVSQKLLSDAAQTKKMLMGKSAKAFDKAYIDSEVAYHKAVINALETLLIPQTDNAELKQLLQKVMPSFKAHLGHAQMLQKSYK